MKKSLLALAVLGAYAGTAMAQSSVTLFGIVDASARFVKNDDQSRRVSLATDGFNSNRLGFRGIEDLGGGLKAGFWLEAGFAPDTGTTGSKFFNRRSTVSLISNAGELRLGRDYVPTFWNQAVFDAFGFNGLGSSSNVKRYIHVRQDNSIGYFLPTNLGGIYGQAMMAAGEGGTTGVATSGDKAGRYIGARVGFAAGPFDVSVSGAQQRFPGGSTIFPGVFDDRANYLNVGGSYDFGVFKLMGYIDRVKSDDAKETHGSISALFRMGQSEIRASYNRSKLDAAVDSTVQQVGVGYLYNLSKRTAMYGTVSWLDNNDGSAVGLPGGLGTPGSGGASKGFDLGVRHIF